MAQAPRVLKSHWHLTIEGLTTVSPQEFYLLVEAAIVAREIPDLTMSRVRWRESGPLSPEREYLRIQRKGLAFDLCGAPFGEGFFISWWLGEFRRGALLAAAILLGGLFLTVFLIFQTGFLSGLLFGFIVTAAVIVYLKMAAPASMAGWDDPLRMLPGIGIYYNLLVSPQTYYEQDTTQMFQNCVGSAVKEVVNSLNDANGLRALTPEQEKPVMKGFLDTRRLGGL